MHACLKHIGLSKVRESEGSMAALTRRDERWGLWLATKFLVAPCIKFNIISYEPAAQHAVLPYKRRIKLYLCTDSGLHCD